MNSLITKENETYYNSELIDNIYKEKMKMYEDREHEYLKYMDIKEAQKYNDLLNECQLDWVNIDNVISFYKNFDLYLDYEKDHKTNINFDMKLFKNLLIVDNMKLLHLNRSDIIRKIFNILQDFKQEKEAYKSGRRNKKKVNRKDINRYLGFSIGYLLIFIIKEVVIGYFDTFEFDYDFDNVKITKSFLNLEVNTKYENLVVNDIIQGIKYVLNKSDIKSNNLYINNELKNENLKKCKIIKKYIANGKKYFFNY